MWLSTSEITKKSPKNGSLNRDLLKFLTTYFGCHLVNPHVQTVQNMYGKGGQRVCKAELRPPEVDPYFERKKITLGGVAKTKQNLIFFCRHAGDSILKPPTFPIARLNCYTPNFLGLPQKLTCN